MCGEYAFFYYVVPRDFHAIILFLYCYTPFLAKAKRVELVAQWTPHVVEDRHSGALEKSPPDPWVESRSPWDDKTIQGRGPRFEDSRQGHQYRLRYTKIMDTLTSSVADTPPTSAAPSTVAEPVKKKLPLAIRKNSASDQSNIQFFNVV